jgi:hypothetical protein
MYIYVIKVGDQDDFRAKFEKCLEDDIEAIGLGWS